MSATTKARPAISQRSNPRSARHRSRGSSVAESWRSQPWSLRVLRGFLGVTFVYAGLNKFADANFFHNGSPDYIGSQLKTFAQGSPLSGLLHVLGQNPVFTGLAIALTEIAVGLGTLFGIAPVLLAASGFAINLGLTLTATWHIHPYFLGSDSMYAVGWAAYTAGLVEIELRRRRGTTRKGVRVAEAGGMGRREVLRGGVLAGATIIAAGAAKAFAGSPTKTTSALGSDAGASQGSTGGAGTAGGTASSSGSGGPSVAGTPIVDLANLPVGQAMGFQAPGVGPAALVRLGMNDVVAFSRACTHAGCLVGYDSSSRILVCPCHGAQFDPANGATPIAGPTSTPLAPITVAVDRSTGQVVLPA
jgi:thiosulfate dehydrogenase [quinone] large subunit